MREPNRCDLLEQLRRELRNFEATARYLQPQPEDLPDLAGIDVYGGTFALNGTVGGDHLIYVNFARRYNLEARIARALDEGRGDIAEHLRRCQRTAGIVLMDVAGHQVTDALPAAMLHQALLLGAVYELDLSGQITRRLFEHLNTRVYESSGAHKFVSLAYGEISDDARFRFLSAGQPFPLVFSAAHDRFMDVPRHLSVSFPPLGMLPSFDGIDRTSAPSALGFKDGYQMNEWLLMGAGDILLLYTDGLAEHAREDTLYVSGALERRLRAVKDRTAREIFEAIGADLRAFAEPADDLTLVVVKRA